MTKSHHTRSVIPACAATIALLWVALQAASAPRSVLEQYRYELVPIEPGEFWMGAPDDGEYHPDDETGHPVKLTQTYLIGTTEVTQELFAAVMGWRYGSDSREGHPAVKATWYDALIFCNELSRHEGLTPVYRIIRPQSTGNAGKRTTRAFIEWPAIGFTPYHDGMEEPPEYVAEAGADGFRLPTEAEWEYAARAGEDHPYAGSSDIDAVAWYNGNAGGQVHPVGRLQPNAAGLYDMSGNVAEWVWGVLQDYPTEREVDPIHSGKMSSGSMVVRGGHALGSERPHRVYSREQKTKYDNSNWIGFRVVRTCPEGRCAGPGVSSPPSDMPERAPSATARAADGGGDASQEPVGETTSSRPPPRSDSLLERLHELAEARQDELEKMADGGRLQAEEDAARIREEAAAAWAALGPKRKGGPHAEESLVGFIESWSSAAVVMDGTAVPVNVPEVWEARAALHSSRRERDDAGSVVAQHGYAMIRVEPGSFTMGSPVDEPGRGPGEHQQVVAVNQPFLLGATEITQAMYESVTGENPSHFQDPKLPVENVTWWDAMWFCNQLSELEGLTPAYRASKGYENRERPSSLRWDRDADGYRLPTEVEWEYAARAGQHTMFSGSDAADRVAWFGGDTGNARRESHPVGKKKPNDWGFRDMSGNVFEWLWDPYAPTVDTASNGQLDTVERRSKEAVIRGGSFWYPLSEARVASRSFAEPDIKERDLGFRVARSFP